MGIKGTGLIIDSHSCLVHTSAHIQITEGENSSESSNAETVLGLFMYQLQLSFNLETYFYVIVVDQ